MNNTDATITKMQLEQDPLFNEESSPLENESTLDETVGSQENSLSDSMTEFVDSHPEVGSIVRKLPRHDQKTLVSSLESYSESYSGPLPHPEHLKEYANIYPEAPKVIFSMAESQQTHRMQMQVSSMNKYYGHNTLGLIFGFTLALIFLLGGFTCIFLDKTGVGLTVIGGVIVGLVALFIANKSNVENPKTNSDNPSGSKEPNNPPESSESEDET